MEKVDVPASKAYRLVYPQLLVLVSCMDLESGKPNIITVAWVTPLSINPPMVGILIAPNRYSHNLISRSKEFAVNIPTVELLKKTVLCGKVSGRNVAKFAHFGLTPKPGREIKTPIIEECVAHLECRVVDQVKVGDHTLFAGEVVAAYANDGAFDGQLMDVEKVKQVYQVGGDTFTTLSREKMTIGPKSN
ncbi:MAG: flavin reductase family protein [Candidatus Hadarchaeota archaeon]